MKKILSLMAILMTLTFIPSCDKDDEKDDEVPQNPIAGTTWYSDDHPMTVLYSNSRYWFDFSDSKCDVWWSKDKSGTYFRTHGTYQYTVVEGRVTIKGMLNLDDGTKDLAFTLRTNNNRMDLYTRNYPYFSTLTKKMN